MNNLSQESLNNRPVHFIGCGGAGMAPLAMILGQMGGIVSGSDLEENEKTLQLRQHGINVTIGHSITSLPQEDNTLIVYSSAVSECNPELKGARKRNLECIRRGEMLARIAANYRRTVSISGSHGKTTITAMLVHILKTRGLNVGYMIGGAVKDIESAAAGDGDIFVTEVDESDGTHTLMNSHLALIPNVEDDHCWSVGGSEQLMQNFKTYAARAPKIIFIKSPVTVNLFDDHPDKVIMVREDILNETYFEYFDKYLFNTWGDYQLLNAAMAIEAAVELNIPFEDAMRALVSFKGVDRRMMEHFANAKLCVVEDYAHHPTELRASLSALRKRFPERHLTVVFQPHRYARLERYLEEFTEILREMTDSVIILPVFAAWSEKSAINSQTLAYDIGPKAKYAEMSWEKLAELSLKNCKVPAILAIVGAGDLNKVIPEILKILSSRQKQ